MNTDEHISWFRMKLNEIFNDSKITIQLMTKLHKTDYFTAPASTNKHHAYEGGLFDHSKEMYEILALETKLIHKGCFTERECFVIGMFHDLCKVDTYKPNILKNKKQSEAKPWIVEDGLPLGHGSKSVYVAGKLLDLTERETLGIFWHMGPFDKNFWSNQGYLEKRFPEWRLVHAADLVASYERRDTA